jgi:hypothetical protein
VNVVHVTFHLEVIALLNVEIAFGTLRTFAVVIENDVVIRKRQSGEVERNWKTENVELNHERNHRL